EERDAVKSRLLAVSNKKLMRIFEVASEVKTKYGSPDKLAEAAAKAAGKAKDSAYLARLTKMAQKSPALVPSGGEVEAIDRLGAGPGELVLVAHGSRVRDLTVGATVCDKDIVVAI